MATKRIERTAIEGGRYNHNKIDRYESNRKERHDFRQMLHEALVDDEIIEKRVFPKRDKVYKEFKDKLTPAYRWLLKHAHGMRPEDILGFLLTRFDIRNIASRHVVIDHLSPYWSSYDQSWRSQAGVFHPEHGLIPKEQIKVGKRGDRIKRKKERIQKNQALGKKLRRVGYWGLKDEERVEFFRFAATSAEVRKFHEERSRLGY